MDWAKLGWRAITILVVLLLFVALGAVEGWTDARKRKRIREEVRRELEAVPPPPASPDRVADLERRLAALEAAVRRLEEAEARRSTEPLETPAPPK